MSFEVLIAFSSASFLLALAPGPDNLFVLSQSALLGAKKGLLVVLGLCLGLVLQTLAAALGLGIVVTTIPTLFWFIKILGAIYLLYLAYLSLKSLRAKASLKQGVVLSNRALVLRGLIMNITNPKVQIFFLAFFPQFIAKDTKGLALVLQMIEQGLIFMLMTFIVFGAIALFAGFLSDRLRSQKFLFMINLISAILFVSLALLTLWV